MGDLRPQRAYVVPLNSTFELRGSTLKVTRNQPSSLLGVACVPFLPKLPSDWWLSEPMLIGALAALAMLAYLIAWNAVSRQRTGGGGHE